jgi:uncharacterized protein YcbX
MAELRLSGIYIYPIKSASGIALEMAQVGKRGFQYDRQWMLVDERGKFLTQRQFPRMALIKVQLEGEYLVIAAPQRQSLYVPLHLDNQEHISVEVWGDVCEAIPLGEEVARWFSEFLELSCQLVYMPESSLRPVNSQYASQNEQVSFADAFPFLLISEASLQDLNERLDEPVPMNRFRPNLVVSGCEPFAEDSWRSIRIGSIAFRVVKPCDRCTITTVEQSTGIRGKEPLQTLAQYRRWKGKIFFGQNLLQEQLGMLKIGDSVEIKN